jgi:ABC-type branched-subunit amino acid transport system substrate-binding protein
MGGIVPVLRAHGYTGPIGASQGFFDAQTTRLGAPANDLVISTSIPYLPLAPSTVRVRTAFEARYGPLGPISLFGYAAAQIVMSAVRRSGATARNALLSSLQIGAPIDTVAGTYTFSTSGDRLDPEVYFYTMRDGKFSYLREAHPSSFMVK